MVGGRERCDGPCLIGSVRPTFDLVLSEHFELEKLKMRHVNNHVIYATRFPGRSHQLTASHSSAQLSDSFTPTLDISLFIFPLFVSVTTLAKPHV